MKIYLHIYEYIMYEYRAWAPLIQPNFFDDGLAAEIGRFRYVKGEILSWKLTCAFSKVVGKMIFLFQSWDLPFPKLGFSFSKAEIWTRSLEGKILKSIEVLTLFFVDHRSGSHKTSWAVSETLDHQQKYVWYIYLHIMRFLLMLIHLDSEITHYRNSVRNRLLDFVFS